jgi:hypothetical protein
LALAVQTIPMVLIAFLTQLLLLVAVLVDIMLKTQEAPAVQVVVVAV